METKFNFNSQICTDCSQSERLLALGLKPETADCYLFEYEEGKYKVITESWLDLIADGEYYSQYKDVCFPAWGLDRLLSLLPKEIPCEEENGLGMYLGKRYAISYFGVLGYYTHKKIYDAVILCIEDVIKEGYFNKEYLNGND